MNLFAFLFSIKPAPAFGGGGTGSGSSPTGAAIVKAGVQITFGGVNVLY